MSTTIDSKVVEMRFDNKQFEAGVKTSLSTLDKLKHSLNLKDSAKGLEALDKSAKNVSFNGLSNGLDNIRVKFSSMQVVGATVLNNLTNTAIMAGKKITNALTGPIVNGGINRAFNIENAHFQLQGLLKDEEAVQAVMKDAMDSVDGTAYGYDAAAKAASQFAASGMRAGKDIQSALRAITGVAAMTNSEYESIAQIFTTVSGNGRLMGDQLLQLSSRGMNAAATLAEYLGKTEEEVRKMVTSGDISFEMFASAMDNAFGEHAKKANETFTGAMSNVKAALGRIGAEFISPLIVQNGPIVTLFNALREKINEIKKNVWPLSKFFVHTIETVVGRVTDILGKLDFSDSWLVFSSIVSTLSYAIRFLGKVARPVGKAFKDIFAPVSNKSILRLPQMFKNITEQINFTDEKAEKLIRAFRGLFAVVDTVSYVIGTSLKFALRSIMRLFGMTDDSILGMSATLGDYLVMFRDWIKGNDLLGQGFEKIGSMAGKCVKPIKNLIGQFGALFSIQKVSGGGGSLPKVFDGVNENLEGSSDGIKGFISRIKEMNGISLSNVETVLKDFHENVVKHYLNFDGIFDGLQNQVSGFKMNFKTQMESVGVSLIGIVDRLKMFREFLKSKFSNVGISEILAVIVGVGITKTVKEFSNILDKLRSPILSVEGLLKGLKSVCVEYSKEIKSRSLINIALAIAILAGSVALLTLVDHKKLLGAVGALAGLAVVLFLVSAAMGFIDKTISFGGGAKSILGIAAAVYILVKALKKMEELDATKLDKNVDLLKKIGGALVLAAGLVGIIPGIIAVLSSLTRFRILNIGILSTMGVFIGLAASLWIIVNTLKKMEDINGKKIMENLKAISWVIVGFIAILGVSHGLGIGSAIGILGVVASLKLLISVIEDLGKLDVTTLKSNMDAIIAVLGTFAVLIGLTILLGKFAKGAASGGLGMLGIAASLFLVVEAMKSLAKMSKSDIKKTKWTIIEILAVFGLVVGMSKFAGKEAVKAGAMILLMAGAMVILSVAITMLSHLDPKGMWNAVGAVSVLMLVFAGVIAASKFATGSKATIAMIAVTIGVLTASLAILSMVNTEGLMHATIALCSVMGALAVLLASTMSLKVAGKGALGALALLTLVIGALSYCIYQLAKLPVESVTGVTEGLSKLILSLSASCLLLAAVGKIGAFGAIKGIGVLAALISALFLIFTGIGELASLSEYFEKFIDVGIPLVEKLGIGLGSFFGGIAQGFSTALTAGLPAIGQNLADFMTNASPFFDGIKGIDSGVLDGVSSLLAAITLMTAEGLVDKLTFGIFGGKSMTAFGEELKEFAPAMNTFVSSISGIDDEKAKKVENTCKIISIIADVLKDLPNSGGLVGKLVGNNDADVVGKQMAAFGESLVAYAEAVKDLDTDSIENSIPAAEALAEMAAAIPNSGGLISAIVGDNYSDTFGMQLESFGRSLKTYGVAVTGLNVDAIEESVPVVNSLSEMADAIPNCKGLVSFLTGDNKMDDFGAQLASFGWALVSYSQRVKSLTGDGTNAIRNSISITNSLSELVDHFPDFEKIKMKKFGNQIIIYGKKLTDFTKSIKGLDDNKLAEIQRATTAASLMVRISRSLSNYTNIDPKNISSLGDALKGINKAIVEAAKSSNTDVKGVGVTMVEEIINGVQSKVGDLVSKTEEVMNNVIKSIMSKYDRFYNSGVYLVQGFCYGIKDTTYMAEARAKEMASAADEAARKELDEHSPSKKFYKIGAYVVEGFCNGIVKNKSMIQKSIRKSFVKDLGAVLGEFTSTYKKLLKGLDAKDVTKAAKKSITEIGKQLYKQTDAFKQSKANIKSYRKELKRFQKEQQELQKKDQTKDNKKKLENVAKQIKETNKKIKSEQKQMLKDSQQAFTDYYDSLKDNVKSTLNVLKMSTDTQIDLFKKASDTQIDLFESFEVNSEVSSEDILSNMKSQVEGISKWNENLNKLAEKGIAEGLLTKLKELGPSGAGYVEQFINMTDEQLKEANDLFTQSAQMSSASLLQNMEAEFSASSDRAEQFAKLKMMGFSDGVLSKLSEMGDESSQYIQDLMYMNAEQITKVNQMLADSTKIAGDQFLNNFQNQLDATKDWTAKIGALAAKGLDQGLLKELQEMGPEGIEYVNLFLNMTAEQLGKLDSMYSESLTLPDTVTASLVSSYTYAGTNAAKGFVKGLKKQSKEAVEAAEQMAESTLTAIRKKLGIASPSKMFEEIGRYSDEGLAIGLRKYADVVTGTAEDMGTEAMNSITNAVSKIAEAVDGTMDYQPTIRPVLDLSDVEAGVGSLNTMFSRQQALNVSAGWEQRNNAMDTTDTNSQTPVNNYQFTQNNYSPKALSRLEIYRQTRNQFTALKGATR